MEASQAAEILNPEGAGRGRREPGALAPGKKANVRGLQARAFVPFLPQETCTTEQLSSPLFPRRQAQGRGERPPRSACSRLAARQGRRPPDPHQRYSGQSDGGGTAHRLGEIVQSRS
jgi:hypothetical protein